MLDAAENDDEITSYFLMISQRATDMYLRAVGSSPGGFVPTVADMLSGSVICILYCAP